MNEGPRDRQVRRHVKRARNGEEDDEIVVGGQEDRGTKSESHERRKTYMRSNMIDRLTS